MLEIDCPFCGPRNESEFVNGGPVRPMRPEDLSGYADAEWIDYLTVPVNPIGPVKENWWHLRGCGQWITIERNTATHDLIPRSIANATEGKNSG